jgi:hypothetical protein
MDSLDPSYAEVAECIRKMLFSEVVSDNDSIDDGTESDEDYVKPREGDSEVAEDATSDDDCCNEVHTAESSTHIRLTGKNIVTKLPRVIGQARNTTTPLEAWNCLITDEILDNIVHHTNQYILIIQPNFSR